MMTLTTKLKVKNVRAGYITQFSEEMFYQKINEGKISNILDPRNFNKTYEKWSKTVLSIVEDCTSTKKKSKGWKINRKLASARKKVVKELKKKGMGNEEIRILKIEKNLIDEHMERALKIKRHLNITKEIEKIKKEGGVEN